MSFSNALLAIVLLGVAIILGVVLTPSRVMSIGFFIFVAITLWAVIVHAINMMTKPVSRPFPPERSTKP